ncbi:MAG: hypothetical protein GY749_13455 [Desulfobacteraceae bacterium]|nr:hypothetical protein [Desulfobacteraceae bacterium]
MPVSEAYGRKAFIEFQGYSDKFIRYRLAAKIIKCNGTVPKEKFHTYLGNTVSSTIPIALEQLYGNNMIKKNQKIMLVAFGVGYSWAVTILYT